MNRLCYRGYNMMQCPACGHELAPQKIKHITLHICDGGCGGVWFHWRDLETFDEPRESVQVPYTIQKDKNSVISRSLQYHCPHCTNLVMKRRFVHVIDDILIDEEMDRIELPAELTYRSNFSCCHFLRFPLPRVSDQD